MRFARSLCKGGPRFVGAGATFCAIVGGQECGNPATSPTQPLEVCNASFKRCELYLSCGSSLTFFVFDSLGPPVGKVVLRSSSSEHGGPVSRETGAREPPRSRECKNCRTEARCAPRAIAFHVKQQHGVRCGNIPGGAAPGCPTDSAGRLALVPLDATGKRRRSGRLL
jgi:hypothetical protein